MTKRRGFLRGPSLVVWLALFCSEHEPTIGFQLSSISSTLISRNRLKQARHNVHTTCTSRLSYLSQSSDYDYEQDDDEQSAPRRRRQVRPIRQASREQANEQVKRNQEQAQARHEQALKDPTLLSKVLFEEREDLHPATKRAIAEVLGLRAMTEIQAKTYAEGT